MGAPDPPPVHTEPPPQAKLAGSKPFHATRQPDLLPVPFIPFPVLRALEPDFAPPPPARGYFLWNDMPRVKLRGLGPADSIILRHAVAAGLFDPSTLYLSPLIPTPPPKFTDVDWPVSRNLLRCRDAPPQPDCLYLGPPYKMAEPPKPEVAPPAPETPTPRYPTYPPGLIVEVKPNAGYVALGQVITYHWAWQRHFGRDWPMQPAILTDLPRPYMPDLCHDLGISLIALGDLIVEPPPWPT